MRRRVVIVAACSVAAGAFSGFGIGVGAQADVTGQPWDQPVPVYSTNENGESYGSALGAPSYEAEPDLIAAYGIDGTLGYVRKADLMGDAPGSPEEAAARPAAGAVAIPLYAQDGQTVIGEFLLENGPSKEEGG